MLTATYIFVCALKAFRDVWSNDRLLNVVEQLIGPDIMGHPVWNLRTKTPQNEATTVPWHQGIPPSYPVSHYLLYKMRQHASYMVCHI